MPKLSGIPALWRNNASLIARRRLWSAKFSQGPSGTIGTGTITLVNPTSYRVFQRNASGFGNIAINGTYTGTPGAIEASFNGGAWNVFDAGPAGGVFSGILSGQAGGQGTLSVRWRGNDASVVTRSLVGVGDVFAIGGQSNAVGQTSGNQSYSHATLKACNFANDYTWKELVDPVDDPTGQVDSVSNDTGSIGGSCWPLVATSFLSSQGVPIAFVPCAKSDTSSLQWQPGTDHFDRTTLFGSMLYRAQQSGAKAILWWQGESDVVNAVNLDTFQTRLTTIVSTVWSELGVPMMLCRLEDLAEVYEGFDEAPYNVRINSVISNVTGALAGPSGFDFNTLHYSSEQATTVAAGWWAAMQAAWGYS
jgi:hypothetical protein